jgi:hypothetical protein
MPRSKKSPRRKVALRQAAGRKGAGRVQSGTKATSTAIAGHQRAQRPRSDSKLAKVIELLGRKDGVGLNELTSATKWLPHTARAALTGLRKRGFEIERVRSEGEGSRYQLAAGPKTASSRA